MTGDGYHSYGGLGKQFSCDIARGYPSLLYYQYRLEVV